MNVVQASLASQRRTQTGSQIQESSTTAQTPGGRNQDLQQSRALSRNEKHSPQITNGKSVSAETSTRVPCNTPLKQAAAELRTEEQLPSSTGQCAAPGPAKLSVSAGAGPGLFCRCCGHKQVGSQQPPSWGRSHRSKARGAHRSGTGQSAASWTPSGDRGHSFTSPHAPRSFSWCLPKRRSRICRESPVRPAAAGNQEVQATAIHASHLCPQARGQGLAVGGGADARGCPQTRLVGKRQIVRAMKTANAGPRGRPSQGSLPLASQSPDSALAWSLQAGQRAKSTALGVGVPPALPSHLCLGQLSSPPKTGVLPFLPALGHRARLSGHCQSTPSTAGGPLASVRSLHAGGRLAPPHYSPRAGRA